MTERCLRFKSGFYITPMLPKPLNQPFQSIRRFLTDIQAFDFTNKRTHRHYDISDRENHLSLTQEQSQIMEDCVESVQRAHPESEGISTKDVHGLLEAAVLKVVFGGSTIQKSRLQEALKTLEEKLSAPLPSWEVHQPVMGLYRDGLPTRFGKVTFYLGDEATCAALEKGVRNVIALSQDPPQAKLNFIEYKKKTIVENVKGKCFGRVVVQAFSGETSWSLALKEMALTIDVVNLFADVVSQTGNGGRLYLPGEAERTTGASFAFHWPDTKKRQSKGIIQNASGLYTTSYLAGPFSSFGMHAPARAALKGYGWDRASNILAKDSTERNEMENRILAAMRWAGRATVTELRDNDKKETVLVAEQAFLLYAIALESLLLKKESELAYRLSLRGAHLLGGTAAERSQIQKDLLKLYEVRSKIVHSGSSSVTKEELDKLCAYAKRALFIVLTRRPFRSMKNEKAFQSWFDARLVR